MGRKEGYRRTEVGIIPEDWEVKKLGDVLTLQRGFDLPHRNRVPGPVPIISSAGVCGTHNIFLAPSPGVVTGRYGTIGEVFYVETDYWPLNTTLFVKSFKGNYPLYAFHLLKTIDFKTHSGKSGVPGVNRNDLHEILVLLPPTKAEQTAIATALSDTDALISRLETLVTKKRDIKRGAMQQLLKPKDGWEVKSIGEFAVKIGSGKTPTGGERVYKREGRPFVRSQNIGWGELFISDMAFIDEQTHNSFLGTEIYEKDIFLNITGASIGRSSVADNRLIGGNVNQHVCIIRLDKTRDDSQYLNYILLSHVGQKQINDFQTGGNRQGLNFSQIKSIQVPIPSTLSEQTRIAQILSDMDAEINGLAQKLSKYKQMKQGMMQELLTGKTRLV